MTTHDQLRALVKAHYDRDDDRFRITVLQIAVHDKNLDRRQQLKLLTERMAELPMDTRPFVWDAKRATFADLVLAPAVVSQLEAIALELEHETELFARGVQARRRLLFHGPPGNGKTSAASALAHRLRRTAYVSSLPALIGSHMGESGARLGKLLGALAAPIVLVLDEVDAIGASRVVSDSGAGREYNTVTNTLLTALDHHASGVLVATTNRIDMLDPALVRRFDAEVEFAAPDQTTAMRHAQQLLAPFGIGINDIDAPSKLTSFDANAKHVMAQVRERVLRAILAGKVEAAE